VSEETQALVLNAVPLLVVGILYLAACASLLPGLWQEERRLRDPEIPLALVFPVLGISATTLGLILLFEREPLGDVWLGLAFILLASLPAIAFLLNWRERGLVLSASSRAREATALASAREREREQVNAYTGALSRLDEVDAIARRLIESVTSLLGVELAALVLNSDGQAHGVYAELEGQELEWWRDLRLDLSEPSAIASAIFDAAPFAVYDVEASPYVNRDLAEQTGAKSGVWVPLIFSEEVIGVLAVVTTHERRAFRPDEIVLLQELASETALAIARCKSGAALARALERERLVARISKKVRSELNLSSLLEVAVKETAAALGVDRCFVRLGEPGDAMPLASEWTAEGLAPIGELAPSLPGSNLAALERRTIAVANVSTDRRLDNVELGGREVLRSLGSQAVLATPIVVFDSLVGVLGVHRARPGVWPDADVALIEAVAHELGLAVHTARLLEENARRLRQHESLVEAAHAVTAELRLDTVLQRLVDEVADLLGSEAAHCYLLDERRGVLRCAAVHGLPEELVGFEFDASAGLSGRAISSGRVETAGRYAASVGEPVPHEVYRQFASAIVAPISAGEGVRGVLGVGSRRPDRFDEADVEVIEAFAGLAGLALRNAEAFEERGRQARVQRGFYRIASVLAQPLSLTETVNAVGQAAAEALGGSFAAVLMPRRSGLELASTQGLPESLVTALGERPPLLDATLAAALEDGRVLASPNVRSDARFGGAWRDLAVRAGYRGLLAAPLAAPREETGTGLALVFFEQERRLDDDDLELARHLAGAARGAFERSALYEQERAARSLAQELARTGALLATELDPAAVLDEVVRQAPLLVGAEACAIRVLEDEELVVTAVEADEGGDDLLGSRAPATVRLSGDAVQSRTPVAIEDASMDERLADADPLLRRGYVGFLGVPLIAPEGATHGVLAVYSRRPRSWRKDEIEALMALAANASAALSNAELYQRVAVERERSFAILANIADGIVAVDRDGTVVSWNRAAEQITGVPAHEALGRTPFQVLGRDLQSDGEAPAGDRLVPISRGQEEVWLSLTEAVMRDPAGAVAGRIFAFRDISSEHLVEQMKSDFVSTVSEEIRRPLTSIYGFAETLLRQDILFGEEERRTFLSYIASESERLTQIVDALLNVARLDTGDLELNIVPTDVVAVVGEVVDTLQRADSGVNSHRFVVDVPGEPLSAQADPERLRQVLQNLMDNAVKYSPDGGTVTVTARRRAATVEISIADEGIGIPAGEQKRIFQKFYRADSAPSREGLGGAGLGLFIARGLVAAMGGRMWVSSREGEGASFAFELPTPESGRVSETDSRRVEIPERL
jgi:PAS domain S-box-containing protein